MASQNFFAPSRRTRRKQQEEIEQLPSEYIQKLMQKVEAATSQEKHFLALRLSIWVLIISVCIMFWEYYGRAIIVTIVYLLVNWYFINYFGK